MECDVEIAQGFDNFGNPKVCVIDIKPIKKVNP